MNTVEIIDRGLKCLSDNLGADETEIFIINVDLPGRDFIFYRFEGEFSRYGISAWFV